MTWVNNSLVYFRNGGQINDGLAIAAIAWTALLLVHSAFLHKMKFNSVRILTDICSLSGLITGIAFYLSKYIYYRYFDDLP